MTRSHWWLIALVAACAPNKTPQKVALEGTAQGKQFDLTVAPTSVTLVPGSNKTLAVKLTREDGFSDTITFSAENLPAGLTVTFAPPATDGTGSALLVSASPDMTTPASGTFTVHAIVGSARKHMDVQWSTAPLDLRGIVLDPGGGPLANAKVKIARGPLATTGLDGRFAATVDRVPYTAIVEESGGQVRVFDGLSEDELQLMVESRQYVSQNLRVEAVSGTIQSGGFAGCTDTLIQNGDHFFFSTKASVASPAMLKTVTSSATGQPATEASGNVSWWGTPASMGTLRYYWASYLDPKTPGTLTPLPQSYAYGQVGRPLPSGFCPSSEGENYSHDVWPRGDKYVQISYTQAASASWRRSAVVILNDQSRMTLFDLDATTLPGLELAFKTPNLSQRLFESSDTTGHALQVSSTLSLPSGGVVRFTRIKLTADLESSMGDLGTMSLPDVADIRLVTPDDGAKFTADTTFSWQSFEGCSTYLVTVGTLSALTTQTSFKFPDLTGLSALAKGQVTWTVECSNRSLGDLTAEYPWPTGPTRLTPSSGDEIWLTYPKRILLNQ